MMTISYRTLAAIVAVVLLFGIGAAVVVGDEDDGDDTAATTTSAPDGDDDEEPDSDDEEKDDTTSTTRSGTSTTATTGGSTTSAPTATTAPGATTSTTRRPGATTTRPPTPTTAAPNPTVTNPPPPPPTTAAPSRSADLLVHANIGGTATVRRVTLQVENAGPNGADDLRLTASGGGAAVRSVQAGSGLSCSDNGSTVTCNASDVGVGGIVKTVTIEFGVDAQCAGAPQLTASVSSSTPDPNPGNNALSPRSLCVFAGES